MNCFWGYGKYFCVDHFKMEKVSFIVENIQQRIREEKREERRRRELEKKRQREEEKRKRREEERRKRKEAEKQKKLSDKDIKIKVMPLLYKAAQYQHAYSLYLNGATAGRWTHPVLFAYLASEEKRQR